MEKYKELTLRGLTLGGGKSAICMPVVAKNEEGVRAVLEDTALLPYDMIELRADHIDGITDENVLGSVLETVRKFIPQKPLLFTFRTALEGGNAAISKEDYTRVNLLAVKSHLVDIVDVEALWDEEFSEELTGRIHSEGGLVIGSNHDFEKTPETDEIVRRLVRMQELGMDVSKTAFMPKSFGDVVRLIDASVRMRESFADRPYITMSMGEFGKVTRAIGSFTGSAITFASGGVASAPGQMDITALHTVMGILD